MLGMNQRIWHQALLCDASLAVLGEPTSPIPLGQAQHRASCPYSLCSTALVSKHADPSEAVTRVHHHATGHSRFTQALAAPAGLGEFPLPPPRAAALKSSTAGLLWSWFPNPSKLFSSAVFMSHDFSKAGGCVGLGHNQGSEPQTKFQAGLCFILSYLPSAALSFKLAPINIFSSPITLGVSFISME